MSTHQIRGGLRRVAALTGVAVLIGASTFVTASAATAATMTVTSATFEWAFNDTIQAPWPGASADSPQASCHYLSAGLSTPANATDSASYRNADGNVAIAKITGGTTEAPTWAAPTFENRCEAPVGGLVNQKVVWSGGTGSVDPLTGAGTIAFTGTVTVNFENFRSPLHLTDPSLTIAPDGTGALKATVAGVRSGEGGTSTPLEAVEDVTVADIASITPVEQLGFIAAPRYLGVTVSVVDNFPTVPATTTSVPAQAVKNGKNPPDGVTGAPLWGSWPESLVDLAYRAGLDDYFHDTSPDGSNASDLRKHPLGIALTYGTLTDPDPQPQLGENEQLLNVVVPAAAEGEFVWSIDGTNRTVNLTEAAQENNYLVSTGDIVPILVSDQRLGGQIWSISGQVSDFTTTDGTVLNGKYLGWIPRIIGPPGAGADAGPRVLSGFASGFGLTFPALLAQALAGHPLGEASLGAGLDLRMPLNTQPGSYSAVLTLTALS